MASAPSARPPAAILDASLVVGFCAKEADKFAVAQRELLRYGQNGWQLFAPGVMVGEVLFVLCKKLQDGMLTPAEHTQAVAASRP